MAMVELCDICGKRIKEKGIVGFFNSFSYVIYTPWKQKKTLCYECSKKFIKFMKEEK